MATFATLVARLTDHFSSSGTVSAARHLRHLNEWHRRLLAMPGCEPYRRSTIDVSVAASETRTLLPCAFTRYESLVDVTNEVTLREKDLTWYRALPPSSVSSGSPVAYVPYGVTAAAAQPVAAGTRTYAVSSSASDTARTVTLRVRLLTGQEVQATATLTGVTPVQVGAWTNAVEILQAFLDASTVGSVTLADTSAGTVPYGTIYTPALHMTRSVVVLVPTPSSALTVRVDGIRSIDVELATTDRVWIPDEWDYLLDMGARCNEYEKQDDARYARAKADLDVELKRFKFTMTDRPGRDTVPTGQRHGVETSSNLGSWYPKGRW